MRRVTAVLACAVGVAACGAQAASTVTGRARAPGGFTVPGASAPRSSAHTGRRRSAATTTGTHRATTHTARAAAIAPRPRRPRRPGPPDPGTLPQTESLPSSHTRAFHAEMRTLWRAIQTGAVDGARAAYFPETAYAQLKAIGDATADWEDRLYADFRLDIGAAHALLGAGAARARLLAVEVPGAYAHWVTPGVCENSVGYFEVPNARVVYREDGETRSFGIASMISWRGRWYVVHLGYVGRLSIGGRVDDPAVGPGVSVPTETC